MSLSFLDPFSLCGKDAALVFIVYLFQLFALIFFVCLCVCACVCLGAEGVHGGAEAEAGR